MMMRAWPWRKQKNPHWSFDYLPYLSCSDEGINAVCIYIWGFLLGGGDGERGVRVRGIYSCIGVDIF